MRGQGVTRSRAPLDDIGCEKNAIDPGELGPDPAQGTSDLGLFVGGLERAERFGTRWACQIGGLSCMTDRSGYSGGEQGVLTLRFLGQSNPPSSQAQS